VFCPGSYPKPECRSRVHRVGFRRQQAERTSRDLSSSATSMRPFALMSAEPGWRLTLKWVPSSAAINENPTPAPGRSCM
jgi:hypothetical protein